MFQYRLCFPCLCLVPNGVVVSIGNFKSWVPGFKPRQSQNNLWYSFYMKFFENAPWRPGGEFDPIFFFADTNFRCLTFSILWLKSQLCLRRPEQARFFTETPPNAPIVGVALRKNLCRVTWSYPMTPENLVRFGPVVSEEMRDIHTYIHTYTQTDFLNQSDPLTHGRNFLPLTVYTITSRFARGDDKFS